MCLSSIKRSLINKLKKTFKKNLKLKKMKYCTTSYLRIQDQKSAAAVRRNWLKKKFRIYKIVFKNALKYRSLSARWLTRWILVNSNYLVLCLKTHRRRNHSTRTWMNRSNLKNAPLSKKSEIITRNSTQVHSWFRWVYSIYFVFPCQSTQKIYL